MDISSIALQGLEQADSQLQTAAVSLASLGSSSSAGVDIATLSSDVVALQTAQTSVELNLSLIRTADKIEKATVNLSA